KTPFESGAHAAAKVGEHIRLRDPPSGSVGDSNVQHLSMATQVVETAHYFLDWRDLVPCMNPVEVNVVRLEAAKTRLHGLDHVLSLIAGRVGVLSRQRV